MSDYYRPIPQVDPAPLPGCYPLAGGWTRFSHVERLTRTAPPEILPASQLPETALAPLVAPRAPLAGLAFDSPRLMGILNVTPDSFSDGGRHGGVAAACAHAARMLGKGADLIDIGGESTRPGAPETPEADEIARVVPVIAALRAQGITAPLSLDTRKSGVARAGLDAGAAILNDVSGLRHDPDLAQVAAETGAPLILMHSIGTPETMQALAADAYTDVLLDAFDALAAAIARAVAAGVPRARIMVDPGIGFGKTEAQNLALLRRISLFHGLGCAILLGVSRKGMIGRIGGVSDPAARGPGSAGVGLWAISQGIQMLRVHDMDTHAQALRLWQAVTAAQ
ncbi:Dihydropteroate synthase [Roseibacterium elongatum DSM 19469]|uniref:Dihydropteroate synthase n=1 Tax=Roseicyclus elongatus DSM 19469 TaxID=1294273 RepID=W8ST13_9RHOB|nr:dihydropteroate synthase [Roseibacterium elongatum]AHM05665.1 Dihydropteroate synthase [Roseibacterium elongatum DSM 19469]